MATALLRTAAPWTADAALILDFGLAFTLAAGARLARARRYRAHARCQAAVVLLNPVVVGLTMLPSFRQSFAGVTAARLVRPYFAIASLHALLGASAELLALYVLLVAGTKVIPVRLRFARYKPWMRTALALWWAAVLLGLATYLRWYG